MQTEWRGPEIRMAGIHLITPTGVGTAKVAIDNQTYPASFVILQHCSSDVILGMDVLSQYGTVINQRSESVTVTSENTLPTLTTRRNHALNVPEYIVTNSPCSSIIVSAHYMRIV